jgi:hypothetical protein
MTWGSVVPFVARFSTASMNQAMSQAPSATLRSPRRRGLEALLLHHGVAPGVLRVGRDALGVRGLDLDRVDGDHPDLLIGRQRRVAGSVVGVEAVAREVALGARGVEELQRQSAAAEDAGCPVGDEDVVDALLTEAQDGGADGRTRVGQRLVALRTAT